MSAHRSARTTLLACSAVLGGVLSSASAVQAAEGPTVSGTVTIAGHGPAREPAGPTARTQAPPAPPPPDGAITGRMLGPGW